jgi:hypothetical protein
MPWLKINEPVGGLTDRSHYLHFGDSAGGLGGGEQTSFQSMMKQRGTADIALSIPPSDPYMPTIGSPIYLYDEDVSTTYPVFAGTIDSIETAWWDAQGYRLISLSCVGFEQVFDVLRVTPGRLYQNQTCGAILTDLFGLASGSPVSLGSITDGPVLSSFLVKGSPTLASLFDRLATAANFVWGVDVATSQLYFGSPYAVAAPFTLQQADVLYQQCAIKAERHDFRDKQLIQIDADAFGRDDEVFVGAGQQSFSLMHPVDKVTNAWITKNTQNSATGTFTGLPSYLDSITIGYPTSGSIYNWAPNAPYLAGQVIIDPSNHLQVCTVAGTSSGSAPSWNDVGGTTVDNSVRWQDRGLVGFAGPYEVGVYYWVTALDNTQYGQVLIGATAAECAQNLADAINANDATRGVKFSMPTWDNWLVNASVSGAVITVKNKYAGQGFIAALSESCTHFSWSAAQTSGGITTFGTYSIAVGSSGAQVQGLTFTPGSNIVTLASPLNAGTNLAVEYHRLDGDTIAVEDTALVGSVATIEHGTGKYQALTSDSAATPAQALAEAQGALTAYKTEPETLEFMTFRPGLKTMQSLTVGFSFPVGPSTSTPPNSNTNTVGLCALVGAFVDGSGHVIQPLYLGDGPVLLTAPAGAVALQMGTNDDNFADNVGSFVIAVNGVNHTVPGTAMPWVHTGGINSAYPFGLEDGTAPVSVAVTAGSSVLVAYVSGTVAPNVTWPLTDASGNRSYTETYDPITGTYYPSKWVNGSPAWVIQEITGEMIPVADYIPGAGHFRYTVRAINAAQVGSYLDFWESLGGGSSSGGSSNAYGGGAQQSTNAPINPIDIPIGGVLLKTASYAAAAGDFGKLISFSSASAVALTLPAPPPAANWFIDVEDVGAGALTVDPNGLTLDGASPSLVISQNQGVRIFTDGTNYFTERGIGGGSGSIGGVNLQATSYAILTADAGKLISFNSSSPITATLPASPPASPWFVAIENIGTGTLTVARNGNTIDSAASNLTLTQNQGVFIFSNGSAYYTQRGLSGVGTVTSVGLTMPAAEFSVSGSPVTSTGTLAVTKANQGANTVWAGPTSGSAAVPTFRSLVSADLPPVSSLLTLTKYVQNWTSQTSVTVNNGFGSTAVICQVYDASGLQVTPESQTIVDANNIALTFGAAFTGTAVVIGTATRNSNTVYTTSWSAQTSVTVTHNLGTLQVIVQVSDGSGAKVIPESITLTSSNVVTLTFGASFTGSAVVMASPLAITAINSYSTSWTAQTSVTVTHNLGTSNVIVQVTNGVGLEVEPESVVCTSSNVVTLTFGAAFTGSVVVIG